MSSHHASSVDRLFTRARGVRAGLVIAAWVVASCSSSGSLRPPVSDGQVDDGDMPAAPGVVTTPAGKKDAAAGCKVDRECPSASRCYFPVADGCGAIGRCVSYAAAPGCMHSPRCACDGTVVDECAPDGLAPAPLAGGACSDASIDAPAD